MRLVSPISDPISDQKTPNSYPFSGLVPVVQRVDNFTHWINRYPVDKMYSNQCILFAGLRLIRWIKLSSLSTTGCWILEFIPVL